MRPDFTAAVSALVYSILTERCGMAPDGSGPFRHNDVVRAVLGQHATLPDHLRQPLRWATLALDASTLVTRGRPFHALEHEQRWPRLERWRRSRLGPVRDLVRFYESLAVFGWYDEQGDAAVG
ncbi:MAG TPA: hypothetical protein VNO26_05840 [Candidatus Limnocylindria bacterium]|nr:hypothetical protein [Candidatus Limnocylindria bacterium]